MKDLVVGIMTLSGLVNSGTNAIPTTRAVVAEHPNMINKGLSLEMNLSSFSRKGMKVMKQQLFCEYGGQLTAGQLYGASCD